MICPLTTSSDNEVAGGAGNDTIRANHLTWQNGDIIDGGDGTDTLVFTNSGATFSVTPGVMENVEIIQVTSSAGATSSALDLVAVTGVEKVISKNSVVADSFTNIQSAAALEIDGKSGATTAGYVTASYKNSLTTSSTTANVTLKGGSAVTRLQIGGASGADGDEFGTIAITSSGTAANSLTEITQADGGSLSVAGLVVTVAGSADLTLGTSTAAFAAAGATINAAAATGNLTINGTNFETITLGSGDDTLYLGSSQVSQTTASAKVTLNGGSGSNTLAFGAQDLTASGIANGGGTGDADSITNFQTVTFTASKANGASSATRSIEADAFSGIQTIQFEAQNLEASASTSDRDQTVAITNLTAGQVVKGSFLASAGTGADEVVTLAMKSPTGTSDAVTFESVASSAASAHVNSISTLTVSTTTVDSVAEKVETLNLIASRADVLSAVGTQIGAVNAGSTATLNISGARNISIGTVELLDSDSENTTYAVVDASALTGNLTLGTSSADFQATDADDIRVTLGSGTNAVYGGTALDDGDYITGTSGTDTVHLTFGAGAVNLSTIDVVAMTGAGATTSATNWSNVGEVQITNGTASSTLTNIASGQVIKSDDIDNTKTLTLNTRTGVTSLAVTLNGATASAGTLATNATSLTINANATASSKAIDDALILNATPTSVTLTGGGETSSAGTYSTFTLSNSSSGLISSINSSYNGNLNLTGVYFDTNGATVTTGSTTAATTVTVAAASLANGLVNYVDTAGTDTLVFATTGAALGFINVDGFETIQATVDSSAALSMNLRDSSGYNTLILSGTGSGDFANNITVSNIASGTTVRVAGAFGDGADTLTLSAATGSADSLTLTSTTGANFTSGNASAAVTTSGFETVSIVGGGVTGTARAVDLRTNAITTTLTGATTLNLGSASAAQVGAVALATLAATSVETLNVNSTGGAVTVSSLGTMNSLENVNITTATGNKVTIGAGTSTSVDLITASGAGAFEITALTAASLDLIDAAAVTGTVTIGSSSAALTMASGASINTGTGNDSITLSTTNLHAANAGGNTSSGRDTLVLVGAQNSGTGVIDLSAADQVTQVNGVANTAVQTGFESVDVSAVTSTGNYGWSITAAAGGSSIVGSGYNDVIYGGAGADTIRGGAGDDTITLGAGADRVVFSTASTNGQDTITDFVVADDSLDVELLAGGNVSAAVGLAAAAAAVTSASTKALVFADGANGASTSAITDYLDLTDVASFLDVNIVQSTSAAESYAAIVNDLAGGKAYVYNVTTLSNGTLGASQVTLVAVITADAALTTANLSFVA